MTLGEFLENFSSNNLIRLHYRCDGEIIYEAHLTINGEGIDGFIYCDNFGKLECFQLHNKDGFCLSEIYGEQNINKLLIKRLKKIK